MRAAAWFAAGIAALAMGACRQKVGDRCARGEIACDDDRAGALACVDGKMTRVACAGRGGCKPEPRASCDQTLARIGEPCVGGDACAADAIERLRCDGGRFVSAGRCGGPAGCVVEKGVVTCDTSRGESGDPCRTEGDVSCARDTKAALVCEGGRLRSRATCRGPSGCVLDETRRLSCDDTVAEPDDACDLEGQAACSVDGSAELRCIAEKFARVRICRHPPCKAAKDEIVCD